jgi:regulator of replication initiation timing
MFNLFPKKKSVDEIVEDANLTPSWEWTPTQTPSMLQAQNELIEQFLKENHDLKLENQNFKDILKSIKEDVTEEHNNAIKLRNENAELKEKYNSLLEKSGLRYMEAKLQIVQNDYDKCSKQRDEFKHQLNAANKEIEELKKKNNYPIHWGGYDGASSEYPEQYSKWLNEQKDKAIDEFLDVQPSREEPAFLNCVCGDCHEKTIQYNQFHNGISYQDAYAQKKEKSWEDAAADLALKVVKLEEKLELHSLLINQINELIIDNFS